MKPKFFPGPLKFRKWLEENHSKKKELLVGFYRKSSGKRSITWPESVDQALCFGWIDGIRKSIDEESYSIRFTPRNPKSTWSAVNIKKVEELKKLGLMKPAGLIAHKKEKIKIQRFILSNRRLYNLIHNTKRLLKRIKEPGIISNCSHFIIEKQ